MASRKVAGTMANEIEVDTTKAVESINELKKTVKDTTTEWKIHESQAKQAGDTIGASKVKYEGLSQAVKQQQSVLDRLKQEQSGVNRETKEGEDTYQKYSNQIMQAERKLTSMTGQQEKAKRAFELEESGINKLNKEIQQNIKETDAQVERLKAEGKETEANEVQKKRLSKTIEKQSELYAAQSKQLDRLVKSGDASTTEISKQKVALDKTGKALAENKRAYAEQGNSVERLTKELKETDAQSKAHVERLKAEGKGASATVSEYKHLQGSLKNLKSQYDLQEKELKQVEERSGKTSDAYRKQVIQLDKTGKALAETKHKASEMSRTFNKLQPTGIKRVDNAVVKVKDHTQVMAKRAKTSFASLRSSAMTASIGVGILGGALVKGAKSASTLQNTYTENTNLLVTSGEKQKDVIKSISAMQKDGKKYSVEYGESQKNIANGYQELIKRGYTGQQSLGAMKSILQASKASGDDFSDTMKVTTSTLEAFGMRTESTTGMMKNTKKVANELAMAADATSTDFSDLGVGMSYVGTTADQAGLSLADTASTMGVLSNSGIEADKAGTGLRKTINSLMSPTKGAQAALEKYGMSVDDFKDKSGKLKPVATIFDEIGKKVPKGQQANFFHNVFGTTGQNSAAVLAQNVDELKKVNAQVGGAYKNNYVGKLANKNMKSTQNSIKQYKQASNAVMIELGTALMPALSKSAKAMAKSFDNPDTQKGLKSLAKGVGAIGNKLADLIAWIGQNTGKVKAFGAVLLGAFAFGKIISGFGKLSRTLQAFGVTAKVAAGASGIGLLVTAVAAITVGLVELYKHNKKFRNFINGIVDAVKDFGKAVGKWFGEAFKSIGKFFSSVGDGIGKASKSISGFAGDVGDWFKGVGKSINKQAKAIGKSLTNIGKDISKWFKGIGKSIGNGADVVADWFKGLIKGFKKGWDSFLKIAIKIAKGFGRAMIIAIAFPVGIAMIITKPLVKPLQKIFNNLIKVIKSAWNGLTKFLKAVWTPVQKVWTSAWNAISKFFSRTWNSISKTFTKYLNRVKKLLTNALDVISKTWSKSWNAVSKFFSKIWHAIEKAFKIYLNNLKNSLHAALDFISKVWNASWKAISNFFKKTWHGIKNFFTPIIKWLKSTISTTLNSISKTWNRIWRSVSRFFSNTWKNMKHTGHDAIWSLKNTFDDVLGRIHKAFSNTWSKIKEGFKSMWDGMKTLAGKGINAVIKIPNTGIGGINSLIHDFGGPKHAIRKIPKVAFATGTGAFGNVRRAITKPTLAVLNDGNDSPETGNQEMLIHPNGQSELVQGRNTPRILGAGTEVLNAKETAMLMGMQAMPFKSGTGFWSRAWNGVTNVAGNAWSGLKNGVKKFTSMLKFITNAVAHPVKTLNGKLNLNTKGLDAVYKDFGTGFFKKTKGQAKKWWKTLWSMASEASNAGADGGMKGDDYKYKHRAPDSYPPDEWGYFIKECVSFVANRLANSGVSASKFSHLGNGSEWVNAKVPHSKKPKVGDVAVYGPGSEFGNHVAMVTGVQGDKISGEEYNWNYDHKYHKYHGRNASGATTFLDFGLGGSSKAPEVKANSPMAKLIKRQTGGMMKWIQKFISPLNESSTGKDGDVHSWSDDVKKALRKLGLSTSASMVQKVLRQIGTESGGNPKAVGGTDGYNEGHATGLMQVKPPTFNANALPGHKNILNGYDNILAGLNYARKKYGENLSFLGNGHGYENGGLISNHGMYEIAERNMPEMVIPLAAEKKSRANQLLTEANERINGKSTDDSLVKQLIELMKQWKSSQDNQGDTYEININVNADTTPATLKKIQQAVEDAITRKQSAKTRVFGG